MTSVRNIPRIVIAGAASSVGKTTVTAGLIAALRGRGLVVQPFKCGPDYIDPTYHECAAGRPCRNLDAWMLDDAQLLEGFARACGDADIAVIEGVMGLFDGCNWTDERASTAQIAKLLGAPVLLIVDIGGAARSAAAVVLGCQHFDPDLALRGVALNFAGSERHARGCGEAIAAATGLPMLGWLPRNSRLGIPERHLGLVPGGEHLNPHTLIAEIAAEIDQRFDIAAVIDMARAAGELPRLPGFTDRQPVAHPMHDSRQFSSPHPSSPRPTLAVARDAAFCFYYPENLELLQEAGATIEFFSPLAGEVPERSGGRHLPGRRLSRTAWCGAGIECRAVARIADLARSGCADLRGVRRFHGAHASLDRSRRPPLAHGGAHPGSGAHDGQSGRPGLSACHGIAVELADRRRQCVARS